MWEYRNTDELYHNKWQIGKHWKWKKKKAATSVTISDLYNTGKYAIKRQFDPSLKNEAGYQYYKNKTKFKYALSKRKNNSGFPLIINDNDVEQKPQTKRSSHSVKKTIAKDIINKTKGVKVGAKVGSKQNRKAMIGKAWTNGVRKKRLQKRKSHI